MSSLVVFAAVARTLVATPTLPQVKASNAPSVPIAPVITPQALLAAEPPRLYPNLNPAGRSAGKNACRFPAQQAKRARPIAMKNVCELESGLPY